MDFGGAVDVEVYIDGVQHFLCFLTVKDILDIMNNYKNSGECLSGKYMWASDMIVIEKLSKDNIIATVEDLTLSGEIANFAADKHDKTR